MAILTCIAISAASFLIGTLFTSQLWDATVLFGTKGPITPDILKFVENYYLTWWDGAMAVKMVLHLITVILVLVLAAKFARHSEATYYFSGGSLLLLILNFTLYITITIPYIRTLVKDPIGGRTTPYVADDIFTKLQNLVTNANSGPLGDAAREAMAKELAAEPMTYAERYELISVLSAANTIGMVLLAGVVILQIGEWYTEAAIAKDELELARAPVVPVTEEKKKQ